MKARQLQSSELPSDAILDGDLIHGRLEHKGRYYRLMRPVSMCKNKYVYVPEGQAQCQEQHGKT